MFQVGLVNSADDCANVTAVIKYGRATINEVEAGRANKSPRVQRRGRRY